jgi:hypothetical protein
LKSKINTPWQAPCNDAPRCLGASKEGREGGGAGGEADGSTGGLRDEGASKQEGGGGGAADAVHKELAAKSSANVSQKSSVYIRINITGQEKEKKYTRAAGAVDKGLAAKSWANVSQTSSI